MKLTKVLVTLVGILFFSAEVNAQIRCLLDVSNPAITHIPLSIHNYNNWPGQGTIVLNGPEEWAYFSAQDHVIPANSMPSPPLVPGTLNLLRDNLGHDHFFETCFPYGADIPGPITIPFRIREFHEDAEVYYPPQGLDGTISNIIIDSSYPVIVSDPMNLKLVTGHLTYTPWQQHGWSTFRIWGNNYFTNGPGNYTGTVHYPELFLPFFSIIDTSQPIADSYPTTAVLIHVSSGNENWGVTALQTNELLPVYTAVKSFYPLPTLHGFNYAGGAGLEGINAQRQDMDLHAGNTGKFLFQDNIGGMFGGLDPAVMGIGIHSWSDFWQVCSGPNGDDFDHIAPNKCVSAILSTNITVGDVPVPPPIITCTDPITLSNVTSTTDWIVVGNHQERATTNIITQSRICQ